MPIRILRLEEADTTNLFQRPAAPDCGKTVSEILTRVKNEGDGALEYYAGLFDKVQGNYLIKVPPSEMEKAYANAAQELITALKFAKTQIEKVCIKTRPKDRVVKTEFATIRQKIVPLDSIGIYAPGGRAAYPSTVLMCAIPSKVAGVKKIVLCSSPPVSASVLVAAKICGIDEIYAVGGAQAIAAMAYGTQTVPKVDKIVGPGNQYVTEAKKQVRGQQTDIDMLAGPTEVFIVADNSSRADFIAADMIAQLEHGPDSAAIVITTNELAKKIPQEIETQLEGLPRKEIVLASLKNSAILTTEFACNEDIVKVASAINNYAPEHLEIQTGKAIERRLMKLVKNAGAVFLGENSCEAFGDYCAGSNHVLPTGGSARFSSGLSVASFTKIIEVVQDFTPKIGVLSKNTAVLARAEGLEGHARSAKKREIKR